MSTKTRIADVIETYSTLQPRTVDALSQQLATEYGILKAKSMAGSDTLLAKPSKGGEWLIIDGEKVVMAETPAVRVYAACCLLRKTLETIESAKGKFRFDIAELPKLECPGLDKAFAIKAEPVPIDPAGNHVGEQ